LELLNSSNSSMSNLGYIQMSLKDPLLSVSLFCHLASIILFALILSETLALYKSFTYLLTYLQEVRGFTLPYLNLPSGRMPPVKAASSAQATRWAHCASR